MGRTAKVVRETGETSISVEIDIDGSGRQSIDTGIVMLDHMLAQVARHGIFDLDITATARMDPDGHHVVEDVAIALGQAFNQALGEKKGIVRMANALAPLDEALSMVVIDISGRGYPVIDAEFTAPVIGDLVADMARHFLETFAREARITLHAQVIRGTNDHHKLESLFKALARALDAATRLDPRIGGTPPSTKGIIQS